MPITRLYFVSGLGADERIFQNLELTGIEKIHIHWVPTTVGEPLTEYCKKLLPQITSTVDSGILGVSFGGIVAQELAKLVEFEKIIIVSSVKSIVEFPLLFKLLKISRLYKFMPTDQKLIAKTHGMTEKMFGVKNQKEKKILRAVLADLDPVFLKWAVEAMIEWKQHVFRPDLLHIHGDADNVFPVKNIHNYLPIMGGTHLMVLNRAKEVSGLIMNHLKT